MPRFQFSLRHLILITFLASVLLWLGVRIYLITEDKKEMMQRAMLEGELMKALHSEYAAFTLKRPNSFLDNYENSQREGVTRIEFDLHEAHKPPKTAPSLVIEWAIVGPAADHTVWVSVSGEVGDEFRVGLEKYMKDRGIQLKQDKPASPTAP